MLLPASILWMNPYFIARKGTGFWTCQATHGHQKVTVFTSVVYDLDSQNM
jgi:hypothetical protein